MTVFTLLEEVAQSITPQQDIGSFVQQLLDLINAQLSMHQLPAEAVPGGSVAKGTFLRGDHDIDIFVRFSLESADEDISGLLEEALASFSPVRVHGSRDYFQFSHEGFDIEVVPVLAISDASQARNVTDVSPLHVTYMSEQSIDTQEIRLAKQFCKSAGVYGAESYIRGVSGHVLDLLLVEYKTFYEFVKAVSSWKAPVILDPAQHHQNPLLAIEKSKHGPVVLVDPVQPLRNAAAALDEEKFQILIDRCKAFVKNPDGAFFVIEEFHEEEFLDRLSSEETWVALHVSHPEPDKKDVAGARVRKYYERFVDELQRLDFELSSSGWNFSYHGNSLVWFVFSQAELPEVFERQGPPISASEHAEQFRKQHKYVEERDGVLFASVYRELCIPQQAVQRLIGSLSSQMSVESRIVSEGHPAQDQ